jgi:hypothetical protein
MHVYAKSAAVDLRHAQFDEVYQFGRKPAFLEVHIHPAESFVTFGRSLGVVDAIAHGESLNGLIEGLDDAESWSILKDP